MRGAPGEEKGGVIDPPSYDLQIYERNYEKDVGGFEDGGDTCCRSGTPCSAHKGRAAD